MLAASFCCPACLLMRILLIYSNQSREMEPAAPVGLSYVASATAAAGHEIKLLDLAFEADTHNALARAIAAFKPELVGVSVRNIDNVISQRYVSPLQEIQAQIEVIRQHARLPDGRAVPISLGGPAISILAEQALDVFGADYAIIGEGEVAFPALVEAIQGQGDFSTISGLCYRVDGTLHRNPTVLLKSFSDSRMEDWVNWKPYQRGGGAWPIQTKRGCPMSCSYCAYPQVEGRRCRRREAGEVVDEIERVQRKSGARTFEFVDSTFNVPASHAIEICEEIIRRRIKANFTVMGLNPRDVPPELFPIMKRAGFNSMLISAEAACDPMLKSLSKGYTMREVERCREYAATSGITSSWFFMLGGPGETMETCEESIRYAETKLVGKQFLSIFFTGIRILPGTRLAEQAVDNGYLAADTDLSEGHFYISPEIDEKKVIARITRAHLRNACIVHASDGAITPALRRIYAGLDMLGVPGPYWRLLPNLLMFPPLRHFRNKYDPSLEEARQQAAAEALAGAGAGSQ